MIRDHCVILLVNPTAHNIPTLGEVALDLMTQQVVVTQSDHHHSHSTSFPLFISEFLWFKTENCKAKGREHSGTQPWCDSKKKNFRSSRGSIHTSEAWNILSNPKSVGPFWIPKRWRIPPDFWKTSLLCDGCGASGKSDPFSAPLLLMHFIHAWRTDYIFTTDVSQNMNGTSSRFHHFCPGTHQVLDNP